MVEKEDARWGCSLHQRRVEALQQLLLHIPTHAQRLLRDLRRLARTLFLAEGALEHLDGFEHECCCCRLFRKERRVEITVQLVPCRYRLTEILYRRCSTNKRTTDRNERQSKERRKRNTHVREGVGRLPGKGSRSLGDELTNAG